MHECLEKPESADLGKIGEARLGRDLLTQSPSLSSNDSVFAMRSLCIASTELPPLELVSDDEAIRDVGIAASEQAHKLTSITGKEHGGLIYMDSDGPHATPSITGVSNTIDVESAQPLVPVWGKVVGDFHSHNQPCSNPPYRLGSVEVSFDQESGWSKKCAVELTIATGENPLGTGFSGDDKQNNWAKQRRGFMADPAGHVRIFRPVPISDEFDTPEGRVELLK